MSVQTDKLINQDENAFGLCNGTPYKNPSHRYELYNKNDMNGLSPPWMIDLIIKKREKLLDIVSCATKQEEEDQVNQVVNVSPSSQSGVTGGETRRPSPEATNQPTTQPLNKHSCCSQSCFAAASQSNGFQCCTCESGLSCHNKAVHLLHHTPTNKSTNHLNGPIVVGKSVSNSSCALSTSKCDCQSCADSQPINFNIASSDHQCKNKSNLNCQLQNNYNYNATSIGLVAVRKHQLIKRQTSDSSDSSDSSVSCSCQCQYHHQCSVKNIENLFQVKMKDDLVELIEANGLNQYELLIDCKRPDSVSSTIIDSSSSFNEIYDDEDFDDCEYEYGPGIVDKLKLKFMSISLQQQHKNCQSNNKLKRCSSLENITVSHEKLICQQHAFQQQQQQNENHKLQANELLLQCSIGKKSASRSITVGGNNKTNGNHQLQHQNQRQYIQHHNNRNNYNKLSTVPVLKRAKSMETLMFQDDQVHQPSNINLQYHCNHQLTPCDNVSIDNKMTKSEKNVVLIEKTAANCIHNCNSDLSKRFPSTKCTGKCSDNACINNQLDDELPKPDTVKTYKRIFENNVILDESVSVKSSSFNNNYIETNKSFKNNNNYKKVNSPMNGVKRKPPVIRATSKSANMKCATNSINSVNCSENKVVSITPPPRSSVLNGMSNVNVNVNIDNNINNKCANLVKPPIAPKRQSLLARINNSPMNTGPPVKTPRRKHLIQEQNKCVPQSNMSNGTKTNCNQLKCSNSNEGKISENIIQSVKSSNLITNTKGNSKFTQNDSSLNLQKRTNHQQKSEQQQSFDKVDDASSCESSEIKSFKSPIKPIANIKPFSHNNCSTKSVNGTTANCNKKNTEINGYDKGEKRELLIEKDLIQDNNKEKENCLNNCDDNSNSKCKSDSDDGKCSILKEINCVKETQLENQTKLETNSVALNDNLIKSSNGQENHDLETIKDEQQVLTSKTIVSSNQNNNRNVSLPMSSLWNQNGQKSTSSSPSNSMVFDFRGKKVKPNIAIQPTPFGVSNCFPKRLSNLNGSTSNDSDDDDNYTGSTEIPPPCGINFFGENVKVGKGSLLKMRNKKVRKLNYFLFF